MSFYFKTKAIQIQMYCLLILLQLNICPALRLAGDLSRVYPTWNY